MSENRKGVWLVTSGEHSDFGVVAAFSTEDAANAAMDKGLGDGVEFCALDPEIAPTPEGKELWIVYLDRDGNACSGLGQPFKSRNEKYDSDLTVCKASIYWTDFQHGDVNGYFVVSCWARDAEHAVKIANELRVRAIATEPVTS